MQKMSLIPYDPLKTKPTILESKWDMLFDKNCKEWIYLQPSLGVDVYPCYSCQQLFSCTQSFLDHINRRTMDLKFACQPCGKNMQFYNRCSLLLHTRRHYDFDSGEVDLNYLIISALPSELIGFLPHHDIPMLYNEAPIEAQCYLNTQFYYPEFSERGRQVIHLKPKHIYFCQNGESHSSLTLKQISANVPKCIFITISEHILLKKTLNNVKIKTGSIFTMPVISKIESLNEPIEEPDIQNSENNNLLVSSEETTKPSEICPECNVIQVNLQAHFIQKNSPVRGLKCKLCVFTAPSKCSLSAHFRIHNSQYPHVCPECGKIFANASQNNLHMNTHCCHMTKKIRYKCPAGRCGKLLQGFEGHFAAHMTKFYICRSCSLSFLDEITYQNHSPTHSKLAANKLFKCCVCVKVSKLFTASETKQHIDWHFQQASMVYVYLCKNCKKPFRSTHTLKYHNQKCNIGKNKDNLLENKCVSCNISFLSAEEKSIRLCINCEKKTQDKIFKCKICKEYIACGSEEDPLYCSKCSMNSKNITKLTQKFLCVLCGSEVHNHEKYSHREKCKYGSPVVVLNEDISCNEDHYFETKRKNINLYVKSKKVRSDSENVGRSEANKELFHLHIMKHKDRGTSYQCMECGKLFVTEPSLMKHLSDFHKMGDIENYMITNKCCNETALKDLINSSNMEPNRNQCYVCSKQFKTEANLKKHIRNH